MKQILEQFDEVTSELIRLVSSTSERELNHAPGENSWSIAQVAQHLSRSYQVSDILKGRVEPAQREYDEKLAQIKREFLDLSTKMQSPAEIVPDNIFIDKVDLLLALKERISIQRHIILHYDLSPVCLDFKIPSYGTFTRYEWIGFNVIHTKRHIHQIKKILEYFVSTE